MVRARLYSLLICCIIMSVYDTVLAGGGEDILSECDNYISITGSSNINQFNLLNRNPGNCTISTEKNSIGINDCLFQPIQLRIDEFECRNQQICIDFQEMLKAEKYPEIIISVSQQEAIDLQKDNVSTIFNIQITLAGITKSYTVPCSINKCGQSDFRLFGSKQLHLSDFNIATPNKILGLIKVKNEVIINFAFIFQLEQT